MRDRSPAMTTMLEEAPSGGRLTASHRWLLVVAEFVGDFPFATGEPSVADRRPLSRLARVRPSRDGRRGAGSGRVPPAAAPFTDPRGAGAGEATGFARAGGRGRRHGPDVRTQAAASRRALSRLHLSGDPGRMCGCASCSGTAISSAAPAPTSTRGARARVEPCRSRRDRAEPGAPPGGVRPRRSRDGRARTSAASFRPSCSTATRASTTFVASLTAPADELERWVEANAAAVREQLPADLVFANHVLLGGPVGARVGRARSPSRRTARSSSTRCAVAPTSARGARRRWPARGRRSSARRTSARCSTERLRAGRARARGAARGRHRPLAARGARRRRSRAPRRGAARRAQSRQRRGAAPRRRERRAARVVPRR